MSLHLDTLSSQSTSLSFYSLMLTGKQQTPILKSLTQHRIKPYCSGGNPILTITLQRVVDPTHDQTLLLWRKPHSNNHTTEVVDPTQDQTLLLWRKPHSNNHTTEGS